MMTKEHIAKILKEIGILLELKGENPFKVRAYPNGARVLENLNEDLGQLIQDSKLNKLKGIGPALEEKITTLFKTGKLKFYDDLKKSLPAGLLELIKLPGLGPKKAKVLFEKLDITSIGQLEYACQENRLLSLDGFGEKSQEKILKSIQFFHKHENLFLFKDAEAQAQEILKLLQKHKDVSQISIAGSLRRKKEIVKDIDFVAATSKPEAVMKKFVGLKGIKEILAHGETKSSVRLSTGLQVDLRCVSAKEYPYTLHHFTGSKEHNVAMRSLAKTKGFKINEYGLFKGERLVTCKTEEEFFNQLGLAYIPPELRENQNEIEAAQKKSLPQLIEASQLKGTFHMHTLYSDGKGSVDQMAAKARELGFEYIGISDHSQSAFYANGMKAADIKRQHQEIDTFNKKTKGFKIFKGVESDILKDGSLDYNDKILASFDFVIASIHSRFKQVGDAMTNRIIKALENPYTTMLGHMTGRLLLSRDGYKINVKKIIDAAVANHKIIELNASPYRLDIDWRHLHYAKQKGLKISINPDAHQVEALGDVRYGVGIARKGWIEAGDVINTMGLKEMENYLGLNS